MKGSLLRQFQLLHKSLSPWLFLCLAAAAGAQELQTIIVTNDLVLEKGAELRARLLVKMSRITIDGNGATLVGPGTPGDTNTLAGAGVGVVVEGVSGVTLRNLKARGFSTGLILRQVSAVAVTGCDFSDNYHNPAHGWGELPPRGGILLENADFCVIRETRANRVWDGIHLVDSEDNLIEKNDFSHCSNTCAKLWKSSRNRFLHNNLSYGLRIDRRGGEVHARDSTGVLIETGSNDNYWYRNDITHGGDGIFIRPLNRWVSTGNVFVENDTSYANNNCVESWSPGNTFIRNKANHGSYGFWLGGSDQTVLIGNEAAYNGLTNGFHNAPEPGFRHGGIVIVAGSSSHTLIQGNHLHKNNGAGIAFRGDTGSQGRNWKTEHWLIQQNRISDNRFGIWGAWGDAVLLAANTFSNNVSGNYFTNVSKLVELSGNPEIQTIPIVDLVGPEVVTVGHAARFDASGSVDVARRPLSFRWFVEGQVRNGAVMETSFQKEGFYRLGLTVDNGGLASIGWRDVLAVAPVERELGTEGHAAQWRYELESDQDGRGRMRFADDSGALVGRHCLRLQPNPYPGAYATAIFGSTSGTSWDFSGKKEIRFWLKARNPNIPGWQNPGPVVRLLCPNGQYEFKPSGGANLLNDPPFSEARWLWMPITIPLAGDARWERSTRGNAALEQVTGISLSFDSWGWEPFTVWLDGLTIE